MSEYKSIDELFENKLFAHGSILIAGAILLFIGWGARGIPIIETETTWKIIFSLFSLIILSYITGGLLIIFIMLIRDVFKVYQSIIAISIFVFAFYAFFLNSYIIREHRAANQYKKLIEEHAKTLGKENREYLEYKIEEIEDERSPEEPDRDDDY